MKNQLGVHKKLRSSNHINTLIRAIINILFPSSSSWLNWKLCSSSDYKSTIFRLFSSNLWLWYPSWLNVVSLQASSMLFLCSSCLWPSFCNPKRTDHILHLCNFSFFSLSVIAFIFWLSYRNPKVILYQSWRLRKKCWNHHWARRNHLLDFCRLFFKEAMFQYPDRPFCRH